MEERVDDDALVLALLNGTAKPFVDAVEASKSARNDGKKGSVIVDLSSDYRFEENWTYGLQGEQTKAATVLMCSSTHVI